jgi:hypothetical protein
MRRTRCSPATFTVLSEYIKHHVKEEEGELFPKIKKSDLDLDALGQELAARADELMATPHSRSSAFSAENPWQWRGGHLARVLARVVLVVCSVRRKKLGSTEEANRCPRGICPPKCFQPYRSGGGERKARISLRFFPALIAARH